MEISPEQLLERFKLPAQDLVALGFCNSNRPAAVKSWAESLPATRISHTSVLLYQALPEICRLQTAAEQRLEMLEILRPYVQQCTEGLGREFLNQPLLIPAGPLKTAVVAQALQKHMSVGYCLILKELCGKVKKGKARDLLSLACQRAIVGTSLLLLRSYQLYTPTPGNLWLELHSLYRVAEQLEIQEQAVRDSLLQRSPATTINQCYLRILLLACARPNQLRQQEVSITYELLEEWCQFAALVPTSQQHQDNVFLVNLSADLPPLYKTRFGGNERDDIRELDLSQLLAALRNSREQCDPGGSRVVTIPQTFSPALVEHVLSAWGQTHKRSFAREISKHPVEVCVGLANLHGQITNGLSLETFVGGGEAEDTAPAVEDPWLADPAPPAPDDTSGAGVPLFTARMLNTSAGGLCLEWREVIPPQVRVGEVLGLRERGRYRWSLGVIRWVQQQRHATRTGIQILAPKSTPYAAAVEQPNGDYSDYLRVLLLPELQAAHQPATLITPAVPFQEFSHVRLNRRGETSRVQLTQRLFATGLVSQFTFRTLGAVETDTPDEVEDFNSVWDE